MSDDAPQLDQELEARVSRRDLEWFVAHPARWYRVRQPVPNEGATRGGECACVLVVQVRPGAKGTRVRLGLSDWPGGAKAREIALGTIRRMGGRFPG